MKKLLYITAGVVTGGLAFALVGGALLGPGIMYLGGLGGAIAGGVLGAKEAK